MRVAVESPAARRESCEADERRGTRELCGLGEHRRAVVGRDAQTATAALTGFWQKERRGMSTDILLATLQPSSSSSSSSPLASDLLPSFYEVTIVDQIDAMLKPAFRHLSFALSEHLPASLALVSLGIQSYWQELYSLTYFYMQHRCMRTYQATLAEKMYGLRRVCASSTSSFLPLPLWKQHASVVLVALLPRFLQLVQQLLASLRARAIARRRARAQFLLSISALAAHIGEETEGEAGGEVGVVGDSGTAVGFSGPRFLDHSLDWRARLSEAISTHIDTALILLTDVLPFAGTAFGLGLACQKALYLFGHTQHATWDLAALDLVLVRNSGANEGDKPVERTATAKENRRLGMLGPSPPPPPPPPTTTTTTTPPATTPSSSLLLLKENWHTIAIISLLMTVRVVEWAIRNQHLVENGLEENEGRGGAEGGVAAGRRTRAAKRQTIEWPRAPKVARGCLLPPSDPSLCSICKQKRNNPCVSTGGYVFCYSCLISSLRADAAARGDSSSSSSSRSGGGGAVSRCPISGLPCREQDIIRLFDQDEDD